MGVYRSRLFPRQTMKDPTLDELRKIIEPYGWEVCYGSPLLHNAVIKQVSSDAPTAVFMRGILDLAGIKSFPPRASAKEHLIVNFSPDKP